MSGTPGDSFFLLRQPIGPPEVPRCWSWSSLTSWRRCPRQWWLSRSRYANAPTPYPQPIYPSTVEGILLHEALDGFQRHIAAQLKAGVHDYQAVRASFSVRRFVRQSLQHKVAETENPRADMDRVAGRVSVDSVVNAFRAVAARYGEVLRLAPEPRSRKPKVGGSEVWVSVASPRICGRIDYLRGGELLDHKTGVPKPGDHDQVRFYGVLVWLATGTAPGVLTLGYLRTGQQVHVAVPSSKERTAIAAALAIEIQGIEIQLAESDAPAKPSVANCGMCAVRQLCSAYWSAPETTKFRLHADTLSHVAARLDVEVSRLPVRSSVGNFVGEASAAELGAIQLRIPHSQSIHTRETIPKSARLLNALVEWRSGGVSVSSIPGTEVFWSS